MSTTVGGHLDEVWSSPFSDPTVPSFPRDAVAARAAPLGGTTDAGAAGGGASGAEEPEPPPPPVSEATVERAVRRLAAEFAVAREAQARQTRALLGVACLIVALLLAYLDRLRAQLRLVTESCAAQRALLPPRGYRGTLDDAASWTSPY